jgi:predicted transcriptional regulator
VQPFLDQNLVVEKDGVYTLTDAGKLLADFIAAELFFEE